MYIEITHELFKEFCRCECAGVCLYQKQPCKEDNCPVWLQRKHEQAEIEEELAEEGEACPER